MCKHRKGIYDEGRWIEVDMYVYLDSEMTLSRLEFCADRVAYERKDLVLLSIPYLISQGKDPLGLILLFHLTLAPKLHRATLLYSLGRCLGSLELLFLCPCGRNGHFLVSSLFLPQEATKASALAWSSWRQLQDQPVSYQFYKVFPL